ncbi:higA, proteic killer suppression protein [Nostoc flagelliforme CCNUN1]|uniref:HigA, proteic killer suppression protein n=1 Tax=Nostoc flagelliforme CCNUN1 TaxID=2038116 RepID=A0A2K8SWR8_9NOSO|nr:type II toxin-antitoxin system RelE/ParE family toxin [Nostoc flagelliforme]AUB39877.1 higA, proteic killer suppression protein [Nostoc flagelliforme CCNUN1]
MTSYQPPTRFFWVWKWLFRRWLTHQSNSPSHSWIGVASPSLIDFRIPGIDNKLKVPPGNRLEVLKGDRKGQHSIRINDQYRICFIWTLQGVSEVEIVDYH